MNFSVICENIKYETVIINMHIEVSTTAEKLKSHFTYKK